MGLPCELAVPGSLHGRIDPPSSTRKNRAARGPGGRAQGRHIAAGELPYLSSLLCHPLAPGGLRYSHGAGIAGPRRCVNNDALHSCDGKGGDGRKKPLGSAALSCAARSRVPLGIPPIPCGRYTMRGLNSASYPCPTPNLQILTSSIPSVWCWASSSCSRSFYSALRARLAPITKAKVYCSTRCT